jgi:hypothetical protein
VSHIQASYFQRTQSGSLQDLTGRFLVSALTSQGKVPATLALIQFPSPGSFPCLRLGSYAANWQSWPFGWGSGCVKSLESLSAVFDIYWRFSGKPRSILRRSHPPITWIAFPPMQCFSVRPSRNSMAMKALPFLSLCSHVSTIEELPSEAWIVDITGSISFVHPCCTNLVLRSKASAATPESAFRGTSRVTRSCWWPIPKQLAEGRTVLQGAISDKAASPFCSCGAGNRAHCL